jgi:hypothetical protein
VTGVASEQWRPVVERLSIALAGLRYPDVVIVSEPDPPVDESWRRYIQYAEVSTVTHSGWRWSRVRHLRCERVGATSYGGAVPLTAEQDAAIRALGWRPPSESTIDEPAPPVPNYHRTLLIEDAEFAAQLGVGALEVLGLHPNDLVWDLPGDDRDQRGAS